MTWILVEEEKVELEGPYECPNCQGHIMLDATFLEQVGVNCHCPYCGVLTSAPDPEEIDDGTLETPTEESVSSM